MKQNNWTTPCTQNEAESARETLIWLESVTEKETGNDQPGACVDVLPRCCNNAASTIISYPDSSGFLIRGWLRLRQDDAAKSTTFRTTSKWLSEFQVYITTETGRPGIRRYGWQMILETSVEDLVTRFCLSKQKVNSSGPLTVSIPCTEIKSFVSVSGFQGFCKNMNVRFFFHYSWPHETFLEFSRTPVDLHRTRGFLG